MDNNNSPYDKKGRPLKNYFGIKLTLSIIAIVIASPAAIGGGVFGAFLLALAIVACVYTCLQNRDYRDGYWEGFRKKSLIATICLWVEFGILFVLMIILGLFIVGILAFHTNLFQILTGRSDGPLNLKPDSAYEYHTDDEDGSNQEDPDAGSDVYDNNRINDLEGGYVDTVDGFETFYMDHVAITLPITLDNFMNSGFYLNDDDLNEMIEAHNSYGYPYYRSSDGTYLGTLFVYNTSDTDSKVKNGIVGGLTINDNENLDLALVGGLKFGSSLEDAVKVLGKDVTTQRTDGDYGYYTWQFSHGYSTSIELDYVGNKLDEVWIMKYDTLSDY